MARPTKLTPAIQDRLVVAIRAGNYAGVACASAGIAPSTYYRWRERGEHEPDGPYGQFLAALQIAEAEAEVHAVAVIRRSMQSDWRAAMAYLERRHPGRWRRQTSTELTGKDGGPIESRQVTRLDLSGLTDEQLQLLQQINGDAHDSDQS